MNNSIENHSVKELNKLLPFRNRIVTRLCNFIFRYMKPINLEIMFIQVPEGMDRNVFLHDFMSRVSTPLVRREIKKEPPYCCAAHILEHIQETKHCYLPDEKMQQYYSICIKEEEYELAEIIKLEADKRQLKIQ